MSDQKEQQPAADAPPQPTPLELDLELFAPWGAPPPGAVPTERPAVEEETK